VFFRYGIIYLQVQQCYNPEDLHLQARRCRQRVPPIRCYLPRSPCYNPEDLHLQARRWRQRVPPIRCYLPTSPSNVTTPKINTDIFTAVRSSCFIFSNCVPFIRSISTVVSIHVCNIQWWNSRSS
jgi:hypothetical protein